MYMYMYKEKGKEEKRGNRCGEKLGLSRKRLDWVGLGWMEWFKYIEECDNTTQHVSQQNLRPH